MRQARLVGVLCVENNLAPRAFTPERLAILQLLASQAANSLQNARLYAELEQENRERRAAEAARSSKPRCRKAKGVSVGWPTRLPT